MNFKKLSHLLLLTGISLLASSKVLFASDKAPSLENWQPKVQIKQFIDNMVSKHQFDRDTLSKLLVERPIRNDIIQRISKPAEGLPWYKYRGIWMKPERIAAGVEFWQKHRVTLEKAEQEYGVSSDIILGILGVETFFGRHLGDYHVIESLHTLGFYYPKRGAFFQSELEAYLLLAREQGWDLQRVKGSYAGAMGMGQFISSSYRRYAVDFNGDGKINLFSDVEDMIGSIANYFKQHGWKNDGFVAQPTNLNQQSLSLVQTDLSLTRTLDDFARADLDISALKNKTPNAGIFAFESAPEQMEYWLCGNNFYAITRYNHNSMYALAVYQLSQAIVAQGQQSVEVTQNTANL